MEIAASTRLADGRKAPRATHRYRVPMSLPALAPLVGIRRRPILEDRYSSLEDKNTP